MADLGLTGSVGPPRPDRRSTHKLKRLLALPAFQSWAARKPILRHFVRREGEAMFDLIGGFCQSQILQAIVLLRLPPLLLTHRMTAEAIAREVAVPADRLQLLLRGGVAIDILSCRRGLYGLTRRGAALAGVPGLQGMIAHNALLYRDLADIKGLLQGDTETELAAFWPYVFGAGAADDPRQAETYSRLMAETQALVAADTIDAVDWRDVGSVMDIGGGTGAFLAALGVAERQPKLTLFDLPTVVPAATERFATAGLADRARVIAGSFRDDPLPADADLITLVRVLYDHTDDTVAALLRAVFEALPAGGRVIISEPMAGHKATDTYFALYCLAMRTGRVRSAEEIAALLSGAGFAKVKMLRAPRPFITSVVCAVKET